MKTVELFDNQLNALNALLNLVHYDDLALSYLGLLPKKILEAHMHDLWDEGQVILQANRVADAAKNPRPVPTQQTCPAQTYGECNDPLCLTHDHSWMDEH